MAASRIRVRGVALPCPRTDAGENLWASVENQILLYLAFLSPLTRPLGQSFPPLNPCGQARGFASPLPASLVTGGREGNPGASALVSSLG